MGGRAVLPKLAVASTLAGCRAASGGLAPRMVVSQNGPHPARELVPRLVTGLVTETNCEQLGPAGTD